MSAQTPIYGITYPDESDLVRDVHQHMRNVATTVESALYEVDQRATPAGAAPVVAQTFDQLSAMPGVTGQTGYVVGDASWRNGVYVHDTAGWKRASDTLGDDLFEFADDAGWSHEYRSWLAAGTVFLNLRLTRKKGWNPGANVQAFEKIGSIKVPEFYPTFYTHSPAFASGTTNNNCNAIGIRVEPNGYIMAETLVANSGLKAGGTIQAMMTWHCTWN